MSSLVRNITHSAKPLLRAATLTTPRTSPFICLRTSTSAYYNAVASSKRFSTTNTQRAELATSLPSKPTVLVSAPVQETLDEEEIDVEFIPPEKANLVITDRAAEVCLPTMLYRGLSCKTNKRSPAIEKYCNTEPKSRCRVENFRRVRWMPWLSI